MGCLISIIIYGIIGGLVINAFRENFWLAFFSVIIAIPIVEAWTKFENAAEAHEKKVLRRQNRLR